MITKSFCVFCFQGDYGDVSDRRALREKLKCNSFDWFVKNVYPDLFVPGESLASGEVSSMHLVKKKKERKKSDT